MLPDWKIVAALTTGKTPRCFSATSYDGWLTLPSKQESLADLISSGGAPFHVVVDAENGVAIGTGSKTG